MNWNKKTTLSFIIILIILVFSIFLIYQNLHQAKSPKNSAITVTTAIAITQDEPIIYTTMGTINALQTVSITPQVTGIIQKILFQEGQKVDANQLLFVIDPTTFAAAAALAKANLTSAIAQYTLAKSNEARYQSLLKQGAISAQDYQQAFATYQMDQAQVEVAQAQLTQAEAQLSYTSIRSPIAGRTGSVNLKVGDLVTENSGTPMVIINRMDEVEAQFNLPQNLLQNLLKAQQNGQTLSVEIHSEHDKKQLAEGQLEFIDNSVNSATGTLLLKALIPNPNLSVWPGQLVTIHLTLGIQKQALVIPSAAIALDQQGTYVYCIVNQKAKFQRVTVDRYIGDFAVISNGLQKGEIVITLASPLLTDGSPIKIDNQLNMASS